MSPIPVPKGRNLLRICHRPPVLEFRLESADAFCSCANQCTGHPSQIVVCAKTADAGRSLPFRLGLGVNRRLNSVHQRNLILHSFHAAIHRWSFGNERSTYS